MAYGPRRAPGGRLIEPGAEAGFASVTGRNGSAPDKAPGVLFQFGSFAYSARASRRIGMSASASFHSARKSW